MARLVPQGVQLGGQGGESPPPGSLVQHQFPGGGQAHPLQGARRPLGTGVEPAQGVDLVAKELDAHGLTGRWVDVHDPAANGQLAGTVNLLGPLVAGGHQASQEVVPVHDLPRFQLDQPRRPALRMGQPAGNSGYRGHHQAGALAQPGQRLQPQGHKLGAGGQHLEGQDFDGGEDHHPLRRHPGAQVGSQGVGRPLLCGKDEQGPARGGREGSQQAGRGRPAQAVHRLGGQFPAHPSGQGGELRQLLPQAQQVFRQVLGWQGGHSSPSPPPPVPAPWVPEGQGVGPL